MTQILLVGIAAGVAATPLILVLSGLSLILFALMGIGEAFVHLRARHFGGSLPG